MARYAIVNIDDVVETICIWDGETDFSPCHQADLIIPVDGIVVGPGWVMNRESGSFAAPELPADEPAA